MIGADISIISRANSFGTVIGEVSPTQILAVEFTNDLPKNLTLIAASFRVANGNDLNTDGFIKGAVAIFRGRLTDFPFDVIDIDQFPASPNLEYLRFFQTFEGINDDIYIQIEKNEKVTAVLFPPYTKTSSTNPTTYFGSLSIFGNFGREKSLFEVV